MFLREVECLVDPQEAVNSGEKFFPQKVGSQTDLLSLLALQYPDIYQNVGKDPKRWIPELEIIYKMISGENLAPLEGIKQAPIDDPEFQQLGKGVYLYRGKQSELHGLWLPKMEWDFVVGKNEFRKTKKWTNYKLGGSGWIFLRQSFKDSTPEFLPENFQRNGQLVKDDLRPIFKFPIQQMEKELEVYAKGSAYSFVHYVLPPHLRLTDIAEIEVVRSSQEMQRFLALAKYGVAVPNVLGYCCTDIEDYLFVEAVKGQNPAECLSTHGDEILRQDAEMLACLCLLGYTKIGFEDFDDKIFDGQRLYLIDAHEFEDLYRQEEIDFRDMVLDPHNYEKLEQFRKHQKAIFRRVLKDTIFGYKRMFDFTLPQQVNYIESFYRRLGEELPSTDELKDLTSFPDGYQTYQATVNLLTDE